MLSLEYIDLVSTIAWRIYEKVSNFQEKFYFNLPIHWDSKAKHASSRPLRKCVAILIITSCQVPFYIWSWYLLLRQNTKHADSRVSFTGMALIAFGSVMNFFITNGSFSNIHKRREWALCLNMVASCQFHNADKKSNTIKWTTRKLLWSITPLDLIVEGIFLVLVFVATSGFFLPLVMDADPFYYMLIDIKKKSREWYITKYTVRPVGMLIWTSWAVLTFFHVVINIFFMILHGCSNVPHVPREVASGKFSIIHNSFGNMGYTQKLAIQLMEASYKQYRKFQIFIRPANDAMYLVVPDGLSGIGVVCVIGGFVTLKGFSKFPLNVYLLFPTITVSCLVLIFVMVPIACGVFENAINFKSYWLGRLRHKERVKRLRGCRPMGIAAGPFGYVQRSLPMEMSNAIVDHICNAIVSVGPSH